MPSFREIVAAMLKGCQSGRGAAGGSGVLCAGWVVASGAGRGGR